MTLVRTQSRALCSPLAANRLSHVQRIGCRPAFHIYPHAPSLTGSMETESPVSKHKPVVNIAGFHLQPWVIDSGLETLSSPGVDSPYSRIISSLHFACLFQVSPEHVVEHCNSGVVGARGSSVAAPASVKGAGMVQDDAENYKQHSD
jgi:hypothetical protein